MSDPREARAVIDREQVIADLSVVVSRMHLNYSDRFELDAQQFYRDTGFMAPGKSMPPEMHTSGLQERREEAWEKWTTVRSAKHQQLLRDCLALLTDVLGSQPPVKEEGLRAFVQHKRSCTGFGDACVRIHGEQICTCGLDEALTASAESTSTPQKALCECGHSMDQHVDRSNFSDHACLNCSCVAFTASAEGSIPSPQKKEKE